MKQEQNISYSFDALKKVVKGYAPEKKIIIYSGTQSYKATGAKQKLDKILSDYNVLIQNNIKPHFDIEDFVEAVKIYHAFEPEVVFAVGGGSIIDYAKLVLSLPSDKELVSQTIKGFIKPLNRKCKFIAIPTTSGSGSESTHFAVVYLGHDKHSLAAPFLLPDHVVLDASLTYSLTAYQTSVSGLDALCQSIESLWAVAATNESRKYALKALTEILDVFPDVVHNPTPHKREKMMTGSHLAGKAINISKTTASHALSYIMTSLYGLPHGHAVALTLPYLLKRNLSETQSFNKTYTLERITTVKNDLLNVFGVQTVDQVFLKIKGLISKTGIKQKLRELGAKDTKDISTIVNSVNTERLSNNPVTLKQEDLKKIVENIW